MTTIRYSRGDYFWIKLNLFIFFAVNSFFFYIADVGGNLYQTEKTVLDIYEPTGTIDYSGSKPHKNLSPPVFSSPGPELLPSLGVRHLSSVVCKLFTFQTSETTGPIGTKLSRNVPWMLLYKVSVFRSIQIFNMAARANNML